MKKLYRKGTVHPSPPSFISDQLAFLPATILTLTAVLSPEDREVLAYLLSCSGSNSSYENFSGHRKNNITTQKSASNTSSNGGKGVGGGDHTASFNCSCFRCYMSYWVRWDSSPNRQVIHEIIDAFEDGLLAQSKGMKNNKRERRKRGFNGSGELKQTELGSGRDELGESESVEETSGGGCGEEVCGGEYGDEGEKGSVRKLVSFIGERIWNVWNQ